MTPQARAKEIRAIRECLRYVQRDADKINLMLVSLHIGQAIAEADTVLDELAAKFGATAVSSDMGESEKSGKRAARAK